MLDFLIAALYGIVQGITEWLPVSSTGHMILLDGMLPLPVSTDFRAFFLVAVQIGSLLAVPTLFPARIDPRKPENRRLWGRVLCAVLPAGLCGLLFDDLIDTHLYRPAVVAAALIVYGIAFLLLDRRTHTAPVTAPDDISFGRAMGVGCFQMLALIPGTSRSGATMLGGSLLGLDRACSAEFSFFLALPTMLAAAGLKGIKLAAALGQGSVASTAHEWAMLAVAAVAAYAVSRAAIRFLLDFVKRHGFSPFGIYRIALGAAVLAFGR